MEPARTPPLRHDDETFWEEFARDVEALRSDPDAWAAYRAEAALWDRANAKVVDCRPLEDVADQPASDNAVLGPPSVGHLRAV